MNSATRRAGVFGAAAILGSVAVALFLVSPVAALDPTPTPTPTKTSATKSKSDPACTETKQVVGSGSFSLKACLQFLGKVDGGYSYKASLTLNPGPLTFASVKLGVRMDRPWLPPVDARRCGATAAPTPTPDEESSTETTNPEDRRAELCEKYVPDDSERYFTKNCETMKQVKKKAVTCSMKQTTKDIEGAHDFWTADGWAKWDVVGDESDEVQHLKATASPQFKNGALEGGGPQGGNPTPTPTTGTGDDGKPGWVHPQGAKPGTKPFEEMPDEWYDIYGLNRDGTYR